MGQPLYEEFEDFAGGVITSLQPDELPPNASPYGTNSALSSIAGGRSVVEKRKGYGTLNASAITGAAAVLGMHNYKRRDTTTGALTGYLLAISSGRLDYVNSSGTVTNLSTGLDSSDPNAPDFATANNLAFYTNGTNQGKVTIIAATPTLQNFGIVAPAAPTAVATGSGVMTGTYEVALSYYNSLTGQESSRSPVTSVTLASQQLRVTIPDAADTQVDYVRIHIRKTTLNAFLFRVSSGTGFNTTHGGWVDNYGNVDLDLSDANLNSLLILSPDEDENDPPPTALRFLEWHNSRLFGADEKLVYYSKIGLPESFDPEFYFNVNPDDGQKITAIHSAYEFLLIFKSRSTYALYGDDPNTWSIRQVFADIGCTSHRSVVTVEGITYWWSERGLVAWDGQGAPRVLGLELLQPDIEALNTAQFHNVVAAGDLLRQRVLFAVAEASQTRNTITIPYNYRLQRFDAHKWDGIDTSSMTVWDNSVGQPEVLCGGYAGQIFTLWTATNDAVPSGTKEGSFTQSGTSLSTITGTGFLDTGGKLIERKVTLVDDDGIVIARRRITANDATTLTLDSAITGLTDAAIYHYFIGGPNFEWRTYWSDMGQPFKRKRFEFVHLLLKANADTTTYIDAAFNYGTGYGHTRNFTITAQDNAYADPYVWDANSGGTKSNNRYRYRMGRTGDNYRLVIRNMHPDEDLRLLKWGMNAELMTSKR